MRRPGWNVVRVERAQQGQRLGCRRRGGALARVQRQHNVTGGADITRGQLDGLALPGPEHIDLRNRLALKDPNAQGVWGDALDGGRIDQRNHLQLPLHLGQVQGQEVGPRPDAGPTAELVHGDNAVGAQVELLDGKGLVLIDQPVEGPLAAAPDQVGPQDRGEEAPRPTAARRLRAARTWLERSLTPRTRSRPSRRFLSLRLDHMR